MQIVSFEKKNNKKNNKNNIYLLSAEYTQRMGKVIYYTTQGRLSQRNHVNNIKKKNKHWF